MLSKQELREISGEILVNGSKVDTDGTLDYFETDQALGDTPTLYISLDPAVSKFLLYDIKYYMNPANAVTYQLYLFEQASADNVQNLADLVYDSGSAKAKGTRYHEVPYGKLPVEVNLTDVGKLYYQIDWSATPGDTPGYIMIRGKRLL